MGNDGMPLGHQSAMMWGVSEDRRTARAHLPPVRLAATQKPLSIYFALDAEAVDDLIRRLAEVRSQMLPAPRPN